MRKYGSGYPQQQRAADPAVLPEIVRDVTDAATSVTRLEGRRSAIDATVPAVVETPSPPPAENDFVKDAPERVRPVLTGLPPGTYKLKGGWALEIGAQDCRVFRGSPEGNRLPGATVVLEDPSGNNVLIAIGVAEPVELEAPVQEAGEAVVQDAEPQEVQSAPV